MLAELIAVLLPASSTPAGYRCGASHFDRRSCHCCFRFARRFARFAASDHKQRSSSCHCYCCLASTYAAGPRDSDQRGCDRMDTYSHAESALADKIYKLDGSCCRALWMWIDSTRKTGTETSKGHEIESLRPRYGRSPVGFASVFWRVLPSIFDPVS